MSLAVASFLAGLALGWLGGVMSGAAWLLWALRRKGDDARRMREEAE